MKDTYPAYPALPAGLLVPVEHQPQYLDVPGLRLSPTANLADALADAHVRAGHGDAVAIIHHESARTLTFAELSRQSARLATSLRRMGLTAGDRLAFRCPNRPEVIVLALAAWRLGVVVVPTPLQARPMELAFFLHDAGARVLFAADAPADTDVERLVLMYGDEWYELLAADPHDGAPIATDSVAVIWHTGGTTGVPKGCYHTQRRFLLAGHAVGLATGIRRGERWAAAAPVGHALGFIYHTIYTLLHGAAVVMVEEFQRPEVLLDAIATHRVDTFTAIAASWAGMLGVLDRASDTSSLRRAFAMWQSASSTEVYDGWKARGVELRNNYGSTAFATWVLVPRPEENVAPASLGRPSPGFEVMAIEAESSRLSPVPAGAIGRMVVRGPTGLTYWNRPDLQQRDVVDGWTLVDDLIRFDPDGNAAYLGRTDFIISTAGYKVAPVEVEEILARHPSVREVAVVGAPDPIRHEVVAAFVVLNDASQASDDLREELQAQVKSALSPYKYPRRIEFIPALPRDAVGKVQPRVLKDLLREPVES